MTGNGLESYNSDWGSKLIVFMKVQGMKRSLLLAAALLFFAGNSLAVTIDFEEFTVGSSGYVPNFSIFDDPPLDEFDPLQSKGFDFYGYYIGAVSGTGPMTVQAGNSGGLAYEGFTGNLGYTQAPGGGVEVIMERSDGGLFNISDLDIRILGDLSVGAHFVDGSSATYNLSSTVLASYSLSSIGTDNLHGLTRVVFSVYHDSGADQFAGLELDNIQVSAVPIPAAVWLFGSALAGLGWTRRRQTS